MDINRFKELLLSGFDVEFDYDDAFYSITTSKVKGKIIFSVANNKKWWLEFNTIDEVYNCLINNKKLIDIIESIPEEEICY